MKVVCIWLVKKKKNLIVCGSHCSGKGSREKQLNECDHVGSSLGYLMSSSWASSWLAWKMGFLVNSSPRIHLEHTHEGHVV